MTITGTGFVDPPTVTFGIGFPNPSVVTAPNVTFVSSTTITVIAPARAAGNWAVEVTNPNNQSVSINPGCTYAFIASTSTGVKGPNENPQSNYSFPMACVNGKSIFGRSPTKKLIERGGSFSSSTLTASPPTNLGLQNYESTVSIKGDSNQAAQSSWLTQDPPNYAVLQSVDSLSDLDICDGPGCPLKVLTAFSYQVLTATEMLTAEALQTGPVASASSPVATLNSSTIVKNVTMTVTGLSLDKPGSFIGLRRWTGTQWEIVASNWGRIELKTPQTGVYAVTTASTQVEFLRTDDSCPGGQNLKNANFTSPLLTYKLLGANLKFADLTGADLTGAWLLSTNLSGAWLGDANLSETKLWVAGLRGAILIKANLSGADLWWADLMEANLRGANLTGANLTGANFTGANLTGAVGANLTGAILPATLRFVGDDR